MLLFLGGLKIRPVEVWAAEWLSQERRSRGGPGALSGAVPVLGQGQPAAAGRRGSPQASREELVAWPEENFTFAGSTSFPCRAASDINLPPSLPKATGHLFLPNH